MKLAATLRYLTTGKTFTSLQYLFRIHRTTLGNFIFEVCNALNDKLRDQIQVNIFCLRNTVKYTNNGLKV